MSVDGSHDMAGVVKKGKKILVIEDEPEVRLALRERLEANGYDIIEAEDGLRGLELARSQNPDLIILDVMLPKMNGFKVARLLKFDSKYKTIPVLMLTVLSQQSDQKQGMTAGADAYLIKPYRSEELLEMVASLIG